MVKIIDLEDDLVSDDSTASTDEDTTEEEDGGLRANMRERPPDPPDPPQSLLPPDASSELQPSAPEAGAGLSSAPRSVRRSALGTSIRAQFRVAPTRYFWDVIAHYGHCVELQRSLRGHGPVRPPGSDCVNMWSVRLQQLAGQPNSHGNLVFARNACKHDTSPYSSESSDSDPDKSDTVDLPIEKNSDDNRDTEHAPATTSNTETASHTAEATDKNEGKPDSDESIKEKSNGVGEKEEIAATTIARPTSSPDHSDFELSDVSDSHAPPDYDTLQEELKGECTRNTGNECTIYLTDRKLTTVSETCQEDLNSEIKDSTDEKETSTCSEEGEAACLPANSIVKDCWEQWVDDEGLFNLSGDVDAPSTSAGVRLPSPMRQGTKERRRVRLETHYRGRGRDRTAKPIQRFIFVPTEKIGRILGKGGRRIREIEKATGANIKIEQRRSSKPVTQLTLIGTDEQISKADKEICVIIRNFKPANAGEPTTASVSSHEEMDLKRLLIGIKNQVIDAEKDMPETLDSRTSRQKTRLQQLQRPAFISL